MKYLATAITNSIMWLCVTVIILYVLKGTGSLLSLLLILIPTVCMISTQAYEPEKEKKKEATE